MLVGVEPTPSSGLLYSPIFYKYDTDALFSYLKHVVSMLDAFDLYIYSVGLLRGRAPWQNGRNSLSRAGKGPSSRVKNKKSKTTVSAFPNLSTNEKTLYDDSIIFSSVF